MPPPPKILIVDDSQDNIEILQELLEDEYQVQLARSGTECLEKAPLFRPDIILLDVMMPGIDGYETCRRLRSDKRIFNLRIIFISAKAQTQEKLAGYAAGADDYIVKPFDKDCVRKKLSFYARMASIEASGLEQTTRLNQLADTLPDTLARIKNQCRSWKDLPSLNEQQKKYLEDALDTADLMLNILKEAANQEKKG